MNNSKPIIFENHDAYLLYQAFKDRLAPEVHIHGELTIKYALSLYYKIFPDERPKNYKRRLTA